MVPLLYTQIAFLDILTALGVIIFYAVFLAYTKNWISFKTLDVNGMLCLFFIQTSNKCSIFCNFMLAVFRDQNI